ncbi:unnamed protein product [Closterium sp. Naga37s-1]|nr:unnamed protein product [Closterium sp. Naga37s-1]
MALFSSIIASSSAFLLHAAVAWWEDDVAAFLAGMGRTLAATALVAAAMVLSHINSLGLEMDMLFSSLRAFLQLCAIGFVLNFVFSITGIVSVPLIFLTFCFMVTIAGVTAASRASLPALRLVTCASIFISCSVSLVALLLLGIFPATPRFLIPVAGMLVGNAMTATGVALRRLREDLKSSAAQVEAALALGANPMQAAATLRRRALVVALAPLLDSTKTVGLISLPGAMTGLIMGGASPFEATHLQIIVMYMLMAAATGSSVLAVSFAWGHGSFRCKQQSTAVPLLPTKRPAISKKKLISSFNNA